MSCINGVLFAAIKLCSPMVVGCWSFDVDKQSIRVSLLHSPHEERAAVHRKIWISVVVVVAQMHLNFNVYCHDLTVSRHRLVWAMRGEKEKTAELPSLW